MQSETTEKPGRTQSASLARSALVFVVLIGIVSLFSDMTYMVGYSAWELRSRGELAGGKVRIPRGGA